MWQESGPQRESRTSKCMSDLVWLGEREHDNSSEAVPNSAGAAPVSKTTTAQKKHLSVTAINAGKKRFTHVFSRKWSVPEVLLPSTISNSTISCKGDNEGGSDVYATSTRKGSGVGQGNNSNGNDSEKGGNGTSQQRRRRPKWAKPLTDLSLSVGDMVSLSAQGSSEYYRDGRRKGVGVKGRGNVFDEVRLLTGNVAAVHEDRVEIRSDKRMRVPRRGRKGSGVGGEASKALDIEDLLGGRRGEEEEEPVLFRIDKDEWAAGIK